MDSVDKELLQKHRKERKELQAKIQSLKKSSAKGDKKRKKEVLEEIAQLEAELEKRQNEELQQLEEQTEQEPEKKDVEVPEVEPETRTHRVSKAQRRRDKKAVKGKEREQMIIEAEAENVHGARNVETQRINHLLKERSLMLQEIPSDGNCLYCAVDDQLKRLGDSGLGTEKLRQMTSEYLREHKCDFLPFISHPDTGDVLTDEQFEDYCVEIANSPAWGGEVELRALSHVLKCCIEVIQATGPPILIGEEYEDRKRATLTFHRHVYGLGEHYNSVKPYIEEETDDM